MNNLNRVFSVVKEQCCRQKRLAEISNFGSIAHKAGIPEHRLRIYLDHLQDLGLIRYSQTDKFIYITEQGRKQETAMETDSTITEQNNAELQRPIQLS